MDGHTAGTEDEDVVIVRGPHGWVNWRAERGGRARRTESHPESIVIYPTWEEFALYTDCGLGGANLVLGPFEFLENDRVEVGTIGRAYRALILRRWDHLYDAPNERGEPRDDDGDYFGGDVGDEMAALLGLALGRRLRSGGRVRQGIPIETLPIGMPGEKQHRVPALEVPHRQPMLPLIADPASLDDAKALIETYPLLDASDAIALVRAARQYVDGLWLADEDPRLAWLKMVGALEVAANRRDDDRHPDPVSQLKRHRPDLHKILEPGPPEALGAVAEAISRLFRQQTKVWSFVKKFDPGPPEVRPSAGLQFDWSTMEEAIDVIYDHRSRDLHDGIGWPWPLCEPPETFDGDVPAERMPFLAVTGKGAQWTSARLPMYLHVFEHVVGGSLRGWWRSLAEAKGKSGG